jgi:hypothetical protein
MTPHMSYLEFSSKPSELHSFVFRYTVSHGKDEAVGTVLGLHQLAWASPRRIKDSFSMVDNQPIKQKDTTLAFFLSVHGSTTTATTTIQALLS